MKETLSEKILETMTADTILFLEVLPLFEKMSKIGKHATIETLITYVLEEV